MIEDLIEKAKQYKIALGLGLLGVIAAGFILLQGRDQGVTDVQQLTEQTSSSSSYKDEKVTKAMRSVKPIQKISWLQLMSRGR